MIKRDFPTWVRWRVLRARRLYHWHQSHPFFQFFRTLMCWFEYPQERRAIEWCLAAELRLLFGLRHKLDVDGDRHG